ncbi:MAG: serine--tRNA ligase, partial [Bacteroidales bacterium]|nr:serine--tRNA ligase [Bacteroidales bacterium]
MLQIQLLRENPQEVIDRLKIKNFDATDLVAEIRELDSENRNLKKRIDDNLMAQNQGAKKIGQLFKEGKRDEAEAIKAEMATLKESERTDRAKLQEQEELLLNKMVLLPNLPNAAVKPGKGAEDNEIVYTQGDASNLPEGALPHWELVKKYDIIDFELGTKITGAGFPVYKGKGARLQRALIDFFLDEATAAGFVEIQPPYMVNEDSAYGTGQLPDKEGQMYHCQVDNFYLIPTAEVPVTNIYRDVILKESNFPLKNCAYSACFRREAGSYGKDVRGLNRL